MKIIRQNALQTTEPGAQQMDLKMRQGTRLETQQNTKSSVRKVMDLLSKVLAIVLTLSLLFGSLCGCTLIRVLILENEGHGKRPPITIPNFVGEARHIEKIADELFEFILSQDYSIYNQLVSNPAALGITAPEPRFWDVSYEADCAEYAYYRSLLSEVYACDTTNLSANERRLYDYLLYFLEGIMDLDPKVYFYYSDPYAPSVGTHMDIPFSLMLFSFRTKQDIDSYLELVADAPRLLAQADAVARERTRLGIIPNLGAIISTIGEAQAYVADVSKNILVTFFEDALNSGEGPFATLTQAERERYAAANRNAVKTYVIPAYETTIALLEEIAAQAKDTTTIASLKYYKEYYAARMRMQGFSVSPEEAIKILDEALDYYLDELLDSETLGYETRLNLAIKSLPNDAAGIIEYFNLRVKEDFPDIGMRPFVVDAASDDAVMESFSAFYMLAPFDDLSENRIVYYPQNISDRFSLATTLAHEAFPGHLYQHNYFGMTDPHPLEMLIGSTAYAEGYAVYSQMYALRYIGLNETDATYANAYELFFRVLGARLDLGINYEGWDLRRTDNYLSRWGLGGMGIYVFSDTASIPLLSLPYGLGPIEFFKMLSTAQKELGSGFDLKKFHKAILDNGGLPFWLLEDSFNAWLKEQRR